jgi:anti-anti-sigma factor
VAVLDLGDVLSYRMERRATGTTVHLEGELDVDGAAPLGDLLDQVLPGRSGVVLDLEQVSFIDLQGVSQLSAARRRHPRTTVVVRNPPHVFDTLVDEFPELQRGLVVLRD